MIYEFACDKCRLNLDFDLFVSQSGSTMSCPKCGKDMRRVFYAPRLLNRQKPGSFVFKPEKMNAWDDRLAHLKDVENKGGTPGLRKAKEQVGAQLFNATLAHKKANYG